MNALFLLPVFAAVFSVDNSRPLAESLKDVRAKRAGTAERAVVKLAPGLYELDETLALGAADSNLELVGEPGAVLTRSVAATPGGVVDCEETPPDAMKFAHVKRILPLFFYDGKWARPARWPNEGFATFSESVDTGVRGEYRSGTAATGEKLPGSFRFKDARAEKWNFADGIRIEGYFFYDWAYESLLAKGYDAEKGVLAFAVPSTFGIGGPKQSSFFTKRRFVVSNVRAELDAPGEFFYDRKTKRVEFVAPEGGVKEFRAVNRPGDIFHIHSAADVVIRGIDFRYAADTAVEIHACTNVVLENCRVSEVGGCGVRISSGRRCAVRGCEIAFVGGGGVSMYGGNRQKLTRGDNVVENCRIHDYALISHVYAAGVSVSVCGNVVRGNEIFNAPHSGVIYGGNEHLFESNHVHHVLLESCDAGVFYTGQDATERGNVLRWNLVEDSGIIRPNGHATGTIAFYLDDCGAGSTIVSNVVRRVPKGVAIGGGHENLVLYNTFEDCPVGVSPDARALSVHKERWDRDWHQTEKLRRMRINEEPWKSRYPLLSQYTPENYPRTPEHCKIIGNTFIRVKKWFSMWEKACRRDMFEIRDNIQLPYKAEARTVSAGEWRPPEVWRGFNLLGLFRWQDDPRPGRKADRRSPGHFREEQFQWLSEWGFNFARLPMDYRNWVKPGDWFSIDEKYVREIDRAIAFGEKYGVHVQLCFHRAPGYTILASDPEKVRLAESDDALRAFAVQWAYFARRYRGIPNERLSFNLFNEPAGFTDERYAEIVRTLVDAIRREDPSRFIVADGNFTASRPVRQLYPLAGVGQAMRGYEPHALSHNLSVAMPTAVPPVWPIPADAVASGYIGGRSAGDSSPVVIENAPAGDWKVWFSLALRGTKVRIDADGKTVCEHVFDGVAADTNRWFKVWAGPDGHGNGTPRYPLEFALTSPCRELVIGVASEQGGVRLMRVDVADGARSATMGVWTNGEFRRHYRQRFCGFQSQRPFRSVEEDPAVGRFATPGMDALAKYNYGFWEDAVKAGVFVMCGEFAPYFRCPHKEALRWVEDNLRYFEEQGWGWAFWNLDGAFGILDSGRTDAELEDFHGHRLDREMLELLRRYLKPVKERAKR